MEEKSGKVERVAVTYSQQKHKTKESLFKGTEIQSVFSMFCFLHGKLNDENKGF